MRSGVVIAKPQPDDLLRDIEAGVAPRLDFLELQLACGADLFTGGHGGRAGAALKDARMRAALSVLAGARRHDALYVTSEDLAIRIAPLLRLAGWRGRMVVVTHAVRSGKWKAVLRHLGRRWFSDMIVVSAAQQDVLVREAGFPPARIHQAHHPVDTIFFDPALAAPPARQTDYVFACGLENRDYDTLLRAADLAPMPIRIAASGFFGSAEQADTMPSNVEMLRHRVPWTDLRGLYAGARFVVVPLNPVPYAAGVTGMMEAMAMGKAVIATASPGIAEYLQDPPGPVVPPNDVPALAAAINALWQDPDRCAALGRRNREWVLSHASIDGYVRRFAALIQDAA